MIPKKFKDIPWSEFVLKVGEKGQFSCNKKMKVGDTGKVVMNVNLIDHPEHPIDIAKPVWSEYKVTKIIYPGFCEGVIIAQQAAQKDGA